MKLLVQGDDYGFTRGVTYGIVDAIDNGILTCSGMFTNMEIAPWAAEFIKERPNFCFGIDFNLVSGPSVSPKEEVPHLVDENGRFIRSNIRVMDPRWQSKEGQEEMFPYDEVYKEIRAQYERFVKLTGRKPGYLHGHSIGTDSIKKATKLVAKEENVPYTGDYIEKMFVSFMIPDDDKKDIGEKASKKIFDATSQLEMDPLGKFMRHKEEILKHEYVMAGGHPGYIDAELMKLTSLSLGRMFDQAFISSQEMKDFVKENNVELIDYYDLVKEGFLGK